MMPYNQGSSSVLSWIEHIDNEGIGESFFIS